MFRVEDTRHVALNDLIQYLAVTRDARVRRSQSFVPIQFN